MITEDFCSFEVAKLLKEKGFDKFNTYGWDEQLFDKDHPRNFSICFDNKEHWISCPSQSMAMKWLREKQIYIRIIEDAFGESYRFEVYSKNPNVKINYYVPNYYKDTYEDAVEAALKYCLENLI